MYILSATSISTIYFNKEHKIGATGTGTINLAHRITLAYKPNYANGMLSVEPSKNSWNLELSHQKVDWEKKDMEIPRKEEKCPSLI